MVVEAVITTTSFQQAVDQVVVVQPGLAQHQLGLLELLTKVLQVVLEVSMPTTTLEELPEAVDLALLE